MNMSAATNFVEIAKAVGAVATPIAVAILAYTFQSRQKVAEAAMAERIKRIGTMSPLLNKIFSYRQRVGNFLDCKPEDILSAKREADREFWTFEYLWSLAFKDAYHEFMHESFDMYRGEGKKAGIRAESNYYPIQASDPGWVAFTDDTVTKKQNEEIYNALQSVIAKDLGFRG